MKGKRNPQKSPPGVPWGWVAFLPVIFLAIFLGYSSTKDYALSLKTTDKIFWKDIPTVFDVSFLAQTEDESDVKEVLDLHDIRNDERYKASDKQLYDAWGKVMESSLARDDQYDRFYVGKSGKKGWGLFANHPLADGEFLGVYSGKRTFTRDSLDYQWNYQSRPNGRYIGLDARTYGNLMRFVNDDMQKRWNCQMVAIAYKNRWFTLYVATRDIAPGEEILVSYGEGYWNNRDIFTYPSTA